MEIKLCTQHLNSGFLDADTAFHSIVSIFNELQKAVDNQQGEKFAVSSLMKLGTLALDLERIGEYEPFQNKLSFQQHKAYVLLVDELKATISDFLIKSHNSSWNQLSKVLLGFGDIWLKKIQNTITN